MDNFNKLYSINVNEFTEKKSNLTYLSWAHAWAAVKKECPGATYTVKKFDNGLPYLYDPKTGYMVFTEATIDGVTYEMWLPVMDGANKAMKSDPYLYDTKFKKGVTCEAATMFDINKTIMRCLVKNLAMFGLGLYIYAGEDLPEGEEPDNIKNLELDEKKSVEEEKKTAKKLAEIKGKWQVLAGNLDEFDAFLEEHTSKGVTLDQINELLAKKMMKKEAKKDE